ncbi:hypothetical protein GCM10022269_11220 [Sphingorhabdus rigui]
MRRADMALSRRYREPLHDSLMLCHLDCAPATPDLNQSVSDMEHGPLDGTEPAGGVGFWLPLRLRLWRTAAWVA